MRPDRFLPSWLRPRRPEALPAIADDTRIYAFGDVHGRADLLQALFNAIKADLADSTRTWTRTMVVGLGDYVDRGMDSRGVIDLLCHHAHGSDFDLIALRGNHEEALLHALDDPQALEPWLNFGGAATLGSYGIAPLTGVATPDRLGRIRDAMRQGIPTGHVDFLRATVDFLRVGEYFFVHAGIRPRIDLARQNRDDLLWIRHDFLNSRRHHGAIIVHGHHIVDQAEIRHNRIGLDTGAYCTGVLTCLVLHGHQSWLLHVSGQDVKKSALRPG